MKRKFTRVFLIGSAIGLLNVAMTNIHLAGRPVGASTSYPYVAGIVFDLQASKYFSEIDRAGSFEFKFLIGAFAGAFLGAIAFKRFKVQFVPPLWLELKGPSVYRRLLWSFIGGFLLIFGARLAGGCTSGHILSGGMQLAVSSLVFAIFVFLSVRATARVFYAGAR